MTWGNSTQLIGKDSNIDHTFRWRLWDAVLRDTRLVQVSVEVEQRESMAAPPRNISDYVKHNLDDAISNIVWPPIASKKFKLKSNFIQMVQQRYQLDSF